MFKNLLGSLVSLAAVGAILFGAAGRWDLPLFWAYLGVWGATALAGAFLTDPTLTKERFRPGPGARFHLSDFLIPPLWVSQYVAAGLDVGRLHGSDGVPFAVQAAALAVLAVALAFGMWATVVNRFFSSAVRIQSDRGHRVITTGPYRFIRHPGYAAFPLVFVGGGLALGSCLAALIGLVMFLPVLRRTAMEDRVLRADLEGYAAYAQKVRYRLLPGVW